MKNLWRFGMIILCVGIMLYGYAVSNSSQLRPGMITAVTSLPGSTVNNTAMTIWAETHSSEVALEFVVHAPGSTQSHITWEAFTDEALTVRANVVGTGSAARLQLVPGANNFRLRATYHESDMITDNDVFVYRLTINRVPSDQIIIRIDLGSPTANIRSANERAAANAGFDLPPVGATPQQAAEHIVAQMTFEEKMAQIIFPRGASMTTNTPQTLATLERMAFGGKVLFAGDVAGTMEQMVRLTYEQQLATVRGSRFNIPMLITIDNEGGATMRYGAGGGTNAESFLGTAGPGNMSLGAAFDPRHAFDMGLVLGREVLAGGFNTNLAPTVDVNSNPANPIIAARSPGSCPNLVSKIGAALIRGTQATPGVLATAKHFPGHGNTATDTHHAVLTYVPGTMEELWRLDLPPFQAAADAGVAAIMTAHVIVPEADLALAGTPLHPQYGRAYMIPTERDTNTEVNIREMPRMATFSYHFMTEVLRNQMGFTGLTMTDGLDMGGVTRFYTPRVSTWLCVMAGNDIALLPATGNNPTLNNEIYPLLIADLKDMAEGRVTQIRRLMPGDPISLQRGFGTGPVIFEVDSEAFMARVIESATRIIRVKIEQGVYDPWAGENQPVLRRTLEEALEFARNNIRNEEHREIERRVSSAAISMSVNREINGRTVLPRELKDGDRVYILTSANAAGRQATLEAAVRDIARRAGIRVTVNSDAYSDNAGNFTQAMRNNIAAADHVLIGTVVSNAATRLPSHGRSQNAIAIWNWINANGHAHKSVNLSMQLPYDMGFLHVANPSAVLHTNGTVFNNVAHASRLAGPVNLATGRLDTGNTGDFPAPVYLSIVEAAFGIINPTGRSPVDVRNEHHANPSANLVYGTGHGLSYNSNARLTLPVLFENGQWAAELGDIRVLTPGGNSTWAYENGMIRLTNGVQSRTITFRFVFENTIDMRGYDYVVMELEEAPVGWFRSIVRFNIDQDAGWGGEGNPNIIRMRRGTSGSSGIDDGGPGASVGNWNPERLRGVGALPAFGESVRIRRIYLEGDGLISTPATINVRNIMDVIPPRTGNTPVTSITTSSQYSGSVVWYPNHSTFQSNIEYTANITLMPRYGWTLDGVAENWFRIFTLTGTANEANTTHAAGSGVITKTFPATTAPAPYPEPTQFVAFTFDDTPSTSTNALLDVLDELGIKATFFVSGINFERARTNPEFRRAVERIIAGGHEITHHAWQHERWTNDADIDVLRADFRRAHDLIYEFTQIRTPWIRMPYGATGSNGLMVAGELGMSSLWGADIGDWNTNNSASLLINRVLTATGNDRLTDGQVYVAHDQAGQTNTIQALPEIAHELRSRGFDFMTSSELREHRNIPFSPGITYPNFVQALPEIAYELRSRGFGFMATSELREHRNIPFSPGIAYPNFVSID